MLHRHPVGKKPHVGELHPASSRQRLRHRRGVDRFDAHHPDLGPHSLDIGCDTRNESSTTHGHENRIDRPLLLAQDFHADRTLARDYLRIVVRMHEASAARLGHLERFIVRIAVRIPVQDHFGATALDRVNLDRRRGYRHHDRCLACKTLCGKSNTLRMIPGRRGNDAAVTLRCR